MKKLILILPIGFLIISCGNSKEAVYDKCLTQANQTYEKNELIGKFDFMSGCMAESGYQRKEFDVQCVGGLSIKCYVKK